MTQTALILAHLKRGKRITPLEALRLYGCFRLGARIWDLKQAGHAIESERIEITPGRWVAEYRMEAT